MEAIKISFANKVKFPLWLYPKTLQDVEIHYKIADHSGNVWTHVVSLRRDNAQAMGCDNLSAWRELVKRQMPNIAKQSKIDMKDLRWYAAYHDKRTNPHVHIIVYSEDCSTTSIWYEKIINDLIIIKITDIMRCR